MTVVPPSPGASRQIGVLDVVVADSGYVQPLDYFGDGTRIPMIVVSKYSAGGHISHTCSDHLSVLKFIEANWSIPPVTKHSRDNLPNPMIGADPYKPINGPAIGDLTDLFSLL